MRKILPLVVIGILVLSGLGANALSVEKESLSNKTNDYKSSERATHTVLGEYGTATWCGFCKYAHGALKELYAEGQLDFYYITHVADKNTVSSSYIISHYNRYGYPTLWWDGGRRVNVGAGSVPAAKSTYTSSINYLGSQSVKAVTIDLSVTWLGGTNMQVDCTVTNNEASTYGGTVQVAICEKVSSRGWIDTGGVTYTMTFLDWAFKDTLSIPSSGTWSDTMTWDGSSHGYPTVTKENTIVIAAVYNDEWHQGYSYPPSSNPFNAYYVDECVGVSPGVSQNNPPEAPDIDGPLSGNADTSYEYTFTSTDPDGDDVSYYIQWGDGHIEPWSSYQASGTSLVESHTWNREGTFTIRAKAKDSYGEESDWSTLSVTMPRNKGLIFNFLERYSKTFPILTYLVGLLN